ncbi:MAG: peptidoglycan-binding protein [Hydrogenophilales bacterium]|nr:peptidoglycan-binding protein [Hydrogenophilales bacterium]
MKSFKQVALVAILSVNLTACETANKIKESFIPDNGKQQGALATGISTKSAHQDGLKIRLIGVTDATKGWHDYRFTLSNDGPKSVDGLQATLIDVDGREHKAAADITELEKLPSAVDTTLLMSAAQMGGAALMFAGFPILGPLVTSGALLYQMGKSDEWVDKMGVFSKSSLYEASIPVNDKVTGSFYFPALKPAKIKIGYLRGEVRQWITLDASISESSKAAAPPVTNTATKQDTGSAMPLQEVQRRLALLGYEPGTQDGKYGRMTGQALRRFQTDHGLTVTGMPDAATQHALSAM